MAKGAAALVSAICILAIASLASAKQQFHVQGNVYCDPCRVQFQTVLSQNLQGATVRLECKNSNTKAVTYSAQAETDAQGYYTLPVEGDHADDICEVNAVKSPRADCSEPMPEVVSSKIGLTRNVGMVSTSRYVNPIGFMTKAALPSCQFVPAIQALTADFDD